MTKKKLGKIVRWQQEVDEENVGNRSKNSLGFHLKQLKFDPFRAVVLFSRLLFINL